MISEFKELVVLPMAMILFLCAASTLPSLTWRGDPADTHRLRFPLDRQDRA